jgi:hypothetical protein
LGVIFFERPEAPQKERRRPDCGHDDEGKHPEHEELGPGDIVL